MAASSVSAVCQVWKALELKELQQTLDNEATSIALRQDQSEISRKALVELSKEFKRSSSEETRKGVSTLLKSFQVEVDSLSKRAKASESALLSVYKKFIDVPDPTPALEQSLLWQKKVAKQADAELEVQQLRETLDEYNKEFVDVKNQEVTIKQLREKIKSLEEDSDSALAEKSKEKEKELRLDFAEKETRLEEEKTRFESKLATAEDEVFALRSALAVAQTQLMELRATADRITLAKGSEYDLVLAESERAAERAIVAEGQIAILQARVDELEKKKPEKRADEDDDDVDGVAEDDVEDDDDDEDGVGPKTAPSSSSWRAELSAKQKEVDQLVQDVRRLQTALTKAKESRVDESSELAERLKAAEAEAEDAKRRLEGRSDYEEIKRELDILKSMECGMNDDDDDDVDRRDDDNDDDDDQQTKTTKQQRRKQRQSLEYLLLARNRSLMNENTQTKLGLSQEREKSVRLDRDNVDLRSELAEQKALVAQLEQHLLQVKTVVTNGDSGGGMIDAAAAAAAAMLPVRSEAEGSASPPLPVSSTTSSSVAAGDGFGEVAIDVESLEFADEDPSRRSMTSSAENVASIAQQQQRLQQRGNNKNNNNNAAAGDDSLLAIVSSQRERFRRRNQDLEAENISNKNRIQSLQDDLDLLRNDNLKLYEKIKFLQSNYSSSSSSSNSTTSAATTTTTHFGNQLESRYASQYEQSLDPFQTFARKERSRKYAAMRPYEKATLALVRFILGSPISRAFAFFYSIFLHLLVFAVLYRFSLLQDCQQDSKEDCAKQFADHMLHVHGGGGGGGHA